MTALLSGAGQALTYRDFWALAWATYTGFVCLFGSLSFLAIWKFARRLETKRTFKENVPSYAVCCMYIIAHVIFLLPSMNNAIFVFGGSPIWTYIGSLFLIHVFFTLVMLMVDYTPWILTCLGIVAGTGFLGCMQTLTMFDYVSPYATLWLGLLGSTPLAIIACFRYMDHDGSVRVIHSWRTRFGFAISARWLVWAVVPVVALGVLGTFFSAGTCILVYGHAASGFWFHVNSSAQWNSRWMQSASIQPCPPDGTKPCHVYLTAGSDLTSDIYVNVHLPLNMPGSRLVVHFNRAEVAAEEYTVPLLDNYMQRRFFVAHLTGLNKGDNSFFLRIGDTTIGEEEYWFRTIPDTDTAVSFVVAGDVGVTRETKMIMERMMESKPYVAFIGGDVAYDNGLLSCSCAWDDFLGMWESNRVDGKYLVPLSLAVGNHDVGVSDNFPAFDSLRSEVCDPSDRWHARPMFFDWFPHEVDSQGRVVPTCRRSTMRKHTIGKKANVWILDSAYAASAQENVDFVDANMSDDDSAVNIGIYHVPMYAANPGDLWDGQYLKELWPAKIFDKHGFKVCFENHAHAYKRTKRLLNNTVVSEGGTVYIGDGRMGIPDPIDKSGMVPPNSENIFAHTNVEYHFLEVTLTPSGRLQIKAINENGLVFDSQEV